MGGSFTFSTGRNGVIGNMYMEKSAFYANIERMEADPNQYQLSIEWEDNPYEQPFLVNQMMITSGPDTQFGSDDLFYLRLGHVMPPMGPPNGEALRVNAGGSFSFSVERLREMQQMLNAVISRYDDNKQTNRT